MRIATDDDVGFASYALFSFYSNLNLSSLFVSEPLDDRERLRKLTQLSQHRHLPGHCQREKLCKKNNRRRGRHEQPELSPGLSPFVSSGLFVFSRH